MSKGEETSNRKRSLSKICLLVLNLCFIVFALCDMPMCVYYLQQLFSSKVLFRNFFKVVSPPSLLSLSRKFFLVKYVEGSSTISVQTFLHKICLSLFNVINAFPYHKASNKSQVDKRSTNILSRNLKNSSLFIIQMGLSSF